MTLKNIYALHEMDVLKRFEFIVKHYLKELYIFSMYFLTIFIYKQGQFKSHVSKQELEF